MHSATSKCGVVTRTKVTDVRLVGAAGDVRGALPARAVHIPLPRVLKLQSSHKRPREMRGGGETRGRERQGGGETRGGGKTRGGERRGKETRVKDEGQKRGREEMATF